MTMKRVTIEVPITASRLCRMKLSAALIREDLLAWSVFSTAMASPKSYLRVDHRVQHVRYEIARDYRNGEDDRGCEDAREVLSQDRLDHVLAHSGIRENILDEDRARDEECEYERREGDHRDERVPKPVPVEDRVLIGTLGP